MNLSLNRRSFIKGLAATSLPFASGVAPVHAQERGPTDHFFVILNIWGGLDVTLSLDPWLKSELPNPEDMFVEYSPSEVLQFSTGVKVGPAFDVMRKHAQDMTIINGVFMAENDVGHETLREYMITGDLKGEASTFAVEASTHFGGGVLGSIIDSSMFPIGGHFVSNISDLMYLEKVDRKMLEMVTLAPHQDPFSFVKSLLEIPVSISSLEEFIRLKDILVKEDRMSEPQLIATSFLTGCSMSAQIDFQDFDLGEFNLDTHTDHPKIHFERQARAWNIVNDFFTTFKSIPYGDSGASLFDHTTFMISNEFARTPFLNSFDGKDHNPLTNSILFAGKGIQGGQVLGGSHLITTDQSPLGMAYHIALPIDFQTGMVTPTEQPNSHMIFPENIIATLCHLFGLPLRSHPSLKETTRLLLPLLKS